MLRLLIVTFCAFATYAILRWLLKMPAAAQLLARPHHRSMHTQPTPNIGGLVFLPVISIAALSLVGFGQWQTLGAALMALVLALLGAIDDRRPLAATTRLPIHFVVSTSTAIMLLPATPLTSGLLLTLVLAIAWSINLFNFMDGSDGIAALMAIAGFGLYAFLAPDHWVGSVALCICSALCGFLALNWHPAKTFMGDAGSTVLGYAAAALGAAGWLTNQWHWTVPLAAFSPFWIDATYTLGKRILRAERFWEGHKSHVYQRLIENGWQPKAVALTYAMTGLVSGILSHWGASQLGWVNLTSLMALICCYLVALLLLERTLT
jgi:UDP-N-acetylmuramyl pentapeptide phosphotransferase/UDP-N-acetylglucosamine-1-phosphate transferase